MVGNGVESGPRNRYRASDFHCSTFRDAAQRRPEWCFGLRAQVTGIMFRCTGAMPN